MSRNFTLLALLFIVIIQCAPSEKRENPRNTSQFIQLGYPETKLNVLGLINAELNPVLNVFIDIANKSIITQQKVGEEKSAEINIEVIIQQLETENPKRFNKVYVRELIDVINADPTGTYKFREQYEIEPGKYQVSVQVTDNQSKKVATVAAFSQVPDINTEKPIQTNMAFLVKDGNADKFIPYLSTSIPAKYDSIQIYAQILPGKQRLIKGLFNLDYIRSDTMPARMMYEPDIQVGDIQYKGVDYDRTQTILRDSLIDIDQSRKIIEIFQTIKTPNQGNFRAELSVVFEDTTINSSLYFNVRSKNFPYLKTPRELAEPLIYLMSEKDYDKIMALDNPIEIKKRIDNFWIKSLKNKQLALQSLQLFYDRVEQANKQFSTFKEGWKTDAGMIYVLYGPPRLVDRNFRDVIWSYGMYQNVQMYDPELTFIFFPPRFSSAYFPYDHYLMRRTQNYYQVYNRIRDDWFSGTNLRR